YSVHDLIFAKLAEYPRVSDEEIRQMFLEPVPEMVDIDSPLAQSNPIEIAERIPVIENNPRRSFFKKFLPKKLTDSEREEKEYFKEIRHIVRMSRRL
ncbi:MAG TPA: hypothetical protein VKK79_03875, partial [Candidatus Lokiarchaeia archaeon]|nr:hypothetical protein [Candidatus Lokiarchaeia archaeon]